MTPVPPRQDSYPGQGARRLATAVALLSMDSVLPIYTCLDVPKADDARAVQSAMRRAIVANREAFAADPDVYPDIAPHVARALSETFVRDYVDSFDVWFGSTFVRAADDYRRFTLLADAIAHIRRNPDQVAKLALPSDLNAGFLAQIEQRPAKACFDRNYPGRWIEDLSSWDAEIYTRLGFYEEMNSPYVPLSLTVGWVDLRASLDWLVERTTVDQQETFRQAAFRVMKEKGDLRDPGNTHDLPSLVARYA